MPRFCSVALAIAVVAGMAVAHDIPSDLTAHVLMKPSGTRLQLLVRIPLRAVRDVDFPSRGGGYMDVEKLAPMLPDLAKLWISDGLEIEEEGSRLAAPRLAGTQISLESDRSFASLDEAAAHIAAPKPANEANLVWNQVWFDAMFEYPIRSDRSRFAIRPGFERLAARVITVLRFIQPDGAVRAYEFANDPGMVELDPRWHQAAVRFTRLGFLHILDGTDHLLFLLCLVIPLRRLRALVAVVTAFTLAHSITLAASAYDLAPDALWFPPLIETLIALSIVYMALENIAGASAVHRRWMIAFGFGLVHGFGFSFALRETLQFAGSHLLTSLVSFNLGVEAGQILVLVAAAPLLEGLFRYVIAERTGTIIVSALVAHTGWHWMADRFEILRRYPFVWPALDAAFAAAATRWAMWALIAAGGMWAARRAFESLTGRGREFTRDRARSETHRPRRRGPVGTGKRD